MNVVNPLFLLIITSYTCYCFKIITTANALNKLSLVSILNKKNDYTNDAIQSNIKIGFHERNKHKFGYDFNVLVNCHAELESHIIENKYGNYSIDFSNSVSVKSLNYALLKAHYNISYWDIPENYLCPPIPSRVDYIHYIADILSNVNGDINNDIVGLDIGTGANCIYPILGVSEYKWDFVGTDCDEKAIQSAMKIVTSNKLLQNKIQFRKQNNNHHIFNGIILDNDRFDFCCCNPPFHSSMDVAKKASERKWSNLKLSNKNIRHTNKNVPPKLNFGGISSELCYDHGGEIGFVTNMIKESSDPFIHNRIKLFTTLISSQENLHILYRILEVTPNIQHIDVIEMEHGNKKSRILTWGY